MKIAFLNIYNGIVERGSEIFVDNIANKLGANHEITVFQVGKRIDNDYKTIQAKGVPFLKINNRFDEELYHLYVLFFTLRCLPKIWKEKYDWIVPINGRWQVLICRLIRFFRGGKILISGHAGIGFDDRWNIIFGKPDIFVALSQTALSWAKNIYPKDKLTFIPNGIDINKFSKERKAVNLTLPKPIILSVSALLPYKRIELLITAVSKLKKVSLLVIGDGPLKERILKLGNELLENRFQLIPYVPHDEIVGYYNACQLFSMPSRKSEAFGIVYLEAMACNLPVVAPDDINRKEIIGEAGILTDVENTGNYAKALEKALNSNYGDKPRRKSENYDWVKIAQKYEKIIGKY